MILEKVCKEPFNFEQITETEKELQNLYQLLPGTRTVSVD
jgi:hypothetical protein